MYCNVLYYTILHYNVTLFDIMGRRPAGVVHQGHAAVEGVPAVACRQPEAVRLPALQDARDERDLDVPRRRVLVVVLVLLISLS